MTIQITYTYKVIIRLEDFKENRNGRRRVENLKSAILRIVRRLMPPKPHVPHAISFTSPLELL